MVAEVPHPTIGTLRLSGIPVKYSETPGTIRMPPPLLGQHTDEVLRVVLQIKPEQLEALRSEGVIA